MRICGLASLLAAVALFATAAQADETFDLFQKLCVDTQSEPDSAVTAADKLGWMALPQQLLDKLSTKMQLSDVKARMISSSSGMHFLLTMNGLAPIDLFQGRFCFLMTSPGSSVDFDKEVSSYVAVPAAQMRQTEFTVYLWKELDGQHIPIATDDATLRTEITKGDLRIVATRHDDEMAGIILVVPSMLIEGQAGGFSKGMP